MRPLGRSLLRLMVRVGRKIVSLSHPPDPFLFHAELSQWRRDGGDERLKFLYPLDSGALVWDVGGFRGEWAMNISARYGCEVWVFEPVAEFFALIEETFAKNDKIRCFPFGLSDRESEAQLSLLGDGSSVHRGGDQVETVVLKGVSEFFEEQRVLKVDLMKINIEGGEYEVVPRLIETGLIGRIEHLLVQFHYLSEESRGLRAAIHRDLSQTHELKFCYEFIWESWQLRPLPA